MKTLLMEQEMLILLNIMDHLSATIPTPITDFGLSYYYGFSPSGFQQDNYDYQNVSLEFPVPRYTIYFSGWCWFHRI